MLKINILGTSFAIESDESQEYMQEIFEMVKQKIAQVEQSFPTTDSLKKAILACFLFSEEIYKMKSKHSEESDKMRQQATSFAERMIHRIDETIRPSEE